MWSCSPCCGGGLYKAAGLVAILAFLGSLVLRVCKLIWVKEPPAKEAVSTAGNEPHRKPPAAHARPPKPVTTGQRALAAVIGCAVGILAFGVYLIVPEVSHHHQVADPRLIWSSSTGSAITDRPAVADGRVFAGNENGGIYGIGLASPHTRWVYATGAAVESSPVVAGGLVYIGSGDGYVYALSAATGRKAWRWKTGAVGRATPVVAGGLVYIGTVMTADGTYGGVMY